MSADALIKGFEGFSAEPFWDHKQWSWGYGTNADPGNTDPNNRPTGTITKAEASAELSAYISNVSDKIAEYDKIYGFTGPQKEALMSFGYNLGPGAIDTLVLNPSGGYRPSRAISDYILMYRKAGGEIISSLEYRRAVEWLMFSKNVPASEFAGKDLYELGRIISEGGEASAIRARLSGETDDVTPMQIGVTEGTIEMPPFQGPGAEQKTFADLAEMRDRYEWLPNTLNSYENYTYNLEFFMISPKDVNDFFNNTSLEDIASDAWPKTNVKKVVIAATGKSAEFNIDGLEVQTVMAGSNPEVVSGASTAISFTLTQIGEVSIGETLKTAAMISGYTNISSALMFIKIKFVGWENNTPNVVPKATKVIPFRLSKIDDITTEVTESGTTMVVEGMTVNRTAMSTTCDTIKENLTIKRGKTVGEALQNFEDTLNEWVRKTAVAKTDNFLITYKFDSIDEATRSEYINSNSLEYEGLASHAPSNNTRANTGAGAAMSTSEKTFTVTTGTSVYDVLRDIIVQSETFKSNLTTVNNEFTLIPTIRVEYKPKENGYNPLDNTEGAEVTYYIDVTKEFVDQNSFDMGKKAINSGAILDSVIEDERLKKKYENLYTGLNTDVMLFRVSLEKQLVKAFSSGTDQYFDMNQLVDVEAARQNLSETAIATLEQLQNEFSTNEPQLNSATANVETIRDRLSREREGLTNALKSELEGTGLTEEQIDQMSSMPIDQLLFVQSNEFVSESGDDGINEAGILRDAINRIDTGIERGRTPLNSFIQRITGLEDDLAAAENEVVQLKQSVTTATEDIASMLQTGMGIEFANRFNLQRGNISNNFDKLGINQTEVLSEELASDVRQKLSSSDADRMLNAISENPVTFTRVAENWIRNDMELSTVAGAVPDDTHLSRIKYNEGHQADLSMITASIQIKGDPYWIENYASPRTRAEVYGRDRNYTSSLPNDSARNAGRNMIMVVENAVDDVDRFDNQKINNLFTWIYMVKGVMSTFSDGIFVQELDLIKIPYLDGYRANDVILVDDIAGDIQ